MQNIEVTEMKPDFRSPTTLSCPTELNNKLEQYLSILRIRLRIIFKPLIDSAVVGS